MDLIITSLLNTGRVSFHRYLKDGFILKNPRRSCILFNKHIILTACLVLQVLLFHTHVACWIQLKILLPPQCFSFKYHRVYCFSSVQESTKLRLQFLQIFNPGLTLAFGSQLQCVSLVFLRWDLKHCLLNNQHLWQ